MQFTYSPVFVETVLEETNLELLIHFKGELEGAFLTLEMTADKSISTQGPLTCVVLEILIESHGLHHDILKNLC